MDAAIFLPSPMGLRDRMLDINISQNSKKVVFVGNFSAGGAGLAIQDGRLRILTEGKVTKFVERVAGFTVDDDAMPAYMDAVKYVEQKYYLKVSRFTNSGYLRLKFANELERRQLTSRVFETRREADHHIAGEHDG